MSREHVEQFEHAGLLVTIDRDESPSSPREDDNAGWMICWHRRYQLGDWHKGQRHPETDDGTVCADPQRFMEWWKENGDGGILLPLFLYDHSGITIRTGPFSCPWDSGQVGWCYVTREKIREEWGAGISRRVTRKARQLAEKCLQAEVETYDDYLTGNVYCYTVNALEPSEDDDADLSDREGEYLGGCCGFYGIEYCREEAKSEASHHAKDIAAAAELEANHFAL